MIKNLNKIFVHEKILQAVEKKCEKLCDNEPFTFKRLSEQLMYFISFDLKKLSPGLYRRYNSNNNSNKGISSTTIGHAWRCEGKESDGATNDFRDLLSYFAFENDWADTLKLLEIDLNDEIDRTIKTKEIFNLKKGGIKIELEQDTEIRNFANRIYIELITRKAGLPIDEEKDVIEEIYDSWYKLFCIIRDELKALPAKCFKSQPDTETAPAIALNILNNILRPHLTEHQAKFRDWLKIAKGNEEFKILTPQELQRKYPEYKVLMKSLKNTNVLLMNNMQKLYELNN